MLPKLGLHAVNLLQSDTEEDDLTATGDGDKDTCWWKQACDFHVIFESGFLPALRSLDLDWHLCLDKSRKKTPLTQCYIAIVWVNLPGTI